MTFFFYLTIFLEISLEATHPAIIKEEFIFQDPPFKSCHASTLTETASGDLLCAWFAGTEEGAPDVSIWQATLEKESWSNPTAVAAERGVPCWNPVLFTLPSSEILLFYKAGIHPQVWSGLLKRSKDGGKSWSKSENLPAGVFGPVKNRPLLTEEGTLLCGSSVESWKRWGAWIDITSDNGVTWSKSQPINVRREFFGIIQPTLFYGQKGVIKLLARSHQIGFICASQSSDQGKTWTDAVPINLPNPNSAIDAINIADGRILLVYNNSTEERYPINIAVSKDGGEKWEMKVVLEDTLGEYSYPCIIQTKDGKVHITYTWNRVNIKHIILDPTELF